MIRRRPRSISMDTRCPYTTSFRAGEADLESLVEEVHHRDPLEERAGREGGGLEDRAVGPERDGGAGAALRCVADDLELGLGDAAVGELHAVPLALAVDLDHEAGGESVDHRDAHAVQSAGHLVALAAKLAAAVELRERDLDARHLPIGRAHV